MSGCFILALAAVLAPMMVLFGLLVTVGWVWLIVIAFKSDQIIWGILILLFTLPAFVYGLLNWDKAKTPISYLSVQLF